MGRLNDIGCHIFMESGSILLGEHGGLVVRVSDSCLIDQVFDPHSYQVVSLIKTHLLPIILVNAHKVVASS